MASVLKNVRRQHARSARASRRSIALELGATDTIDPTAGDTASQVRALLPRGVDRALDASGVPAAIEALIRCLAPRGRIAMVGVPKSLDATIAVHLLSMMTLGASLCGVTEGDADPRIFVPHLIDLFRQGRFPFDKLITTYPITQINDAVDDQCAGR